MKEKQDELICTYQEYLTFYIHKIPTRGIKKKNLELYTLSHEQAVSRSTK